MGKLSQIIFWSAVAVVAFLYSLSELKRSQLGPHHIVVSYCGKVLSDFTTTNPEYVVFASVTNYTPSGVVITHERKTNYYWKVYHIFK